MAKVYGIARIIEGNATDGVNAQAKIYHKFMSCDLDAIHEQAEELERVTGQEHVVIEMDSVMEAFEAFQKFKDLNESSGRH